ncbi:MAG TPA: PEGA domain-containing protein [Terriglobales bacterium]|nr:PEGA domain-containing protein [Terriglobales bacterium]
MLKLSPIMNSLRSFAVVAAVFLFAIFICGWKDAGQVILWPESGTPIVRFTLGKFKEVGTFANRRTYVIETTAENLTSKAIPTGNFSLYLFDKSNVRIGEGWLTLTDVAPGQAVKFQMNVDTSGVPVSATISARSDIPRKISLTVNSVPQGALLKLDGGEIGTTPKMVQVGPGKHMLEFSKEGFNTGHFPLEIGPNDASGGSVSYELGASAHDTIELRDGTLLNGDLETVSGMEVVVRIGGTAQRYNRNQVKRISLVERDTPAQ